MCQSLMYCFTNECVKFIQMFQGLLEQGICTVRTVLSVILIYMYNRTVWLLVKAFKLIFSDDYISLQFTQCHKNQKFYIFCFVAWSL